MAGLRKKRLPFTPSATSIHPAGAIGRIGFDQPAVDASHVVAPMEKAVCMLRSVQIHETLANNIHIAFPSQPQLCIIYDISI